MKAGHIREEYIAIILRELLRGLDYLHNEGKLHRGKAIKILTRLAFLLAAILTFSISNQQTDIKGT